MKESLVKKKKKGFTLIELIVVIAIIAIISLIAIPKVMGYQEDAKKKTDIANAKTIATTAATLVTSGKITTTATKNLTIVASSEDDDVKLIIGALQSVPTPQAKNKAGNIPASFIVHIDKDSNVTVDATGANADGSDALYPTPGSSYK